MVKMIEEKRTEMDQGFTTRHNLWNTNLDIIVHANIGIGYLRATLVGVGKNLQGALTSASKLGIILKKLIS
jgi:hypothetical protein